MKIPLFTCLMTLWSIASFAQEKAALTKEETVNYLNKKLKECIGHYRQTPVTGEDDRIFYYHNVSFTLSGSTLKLYMKYSNYKEGTGTKECDYFLIDWTVEFNPIHITQITEKSNTKNSPVGGIDVKFISKIAVEESDYYQRNVNNDNGRCFGLALAKETHYSVDTTDLGFLQADPSNFNKIKKALEHLRDLSKAEDDPFGN